MYEEKEVKSAGAGSRCGCDLNSLPEGGLPLKIFEQNPEGGEGMSHVAIWGKNLPGRRNRSSETLGPITGAE